MMRVNVEVRSLGAHIWDEEGNRYLDCGGYGVFTLGHCHPRVVSAVIAQVRSHPLASRILLNPALAGAAEALARVAPDGLDYVYFGTSGSEAVETALKLARMHGHRRVIATDNGYHGHSLGALSVTGQKIYRDPFHPLVPGVEFVPFGDAAALKAALAAGPPACVLLEPVQGEGGVVIPPPGYLTEVARVCREHGGFLVLDEIQTGLGRLGTWWAADRESVIPDVLLVGKALSGGIIPVSAAVASEAVFRPFSRDPLIHNATFSGAPIAMAAARAAVEAIEDEDIVARADTLGRTLQQAISATLHATCPSLVHEVRGIGLLIGIEWVTEHIALQFLIEMLRRHMVLCHSANAPRVTRLTPPAVLDDDDVDLFGAALRESAEVLAARFA
jgi:putrescine aminotransferase